MSDERYIVPRNWERFQHADITRSVIPPWIKTYTRLMADDNYISLSGNRRAILHGLWLEYALSRGCLRLDIKLIARRLALNVKMSDLEALNHAGFLEFLQAPLMQAVRAYRQEEEEEVEKDLPLNRSGEEPKADPVDNFSEQEQEQERSEEEFIDVHAELAELTESLAEKMGDPWKDWR